MTPDTQGQHRARRNPGWTAALVAIPTLAVAVLGVGGWLLLRPNNIPVHGTLTLTSTTGAVYTTGATCYGTRDLQGIHDGAQIVVRDLSGAVVATGVLGGGQPQSGTTCVFPVDVTVPRGVQSFRVEIAGHSLGGFTAADLRNGPRFDITG